MLRKTKRKEPICPKLNWKQPRQLADALVPYLVATKESPQHTPYLRFPVKIEYIEPFLSTQIRAITVIAQICVVWDCSSWSRKHS